MKFNDGSIATDHFQCIEGTIRSAIAQQRNPAVSIDQALRASVISWELYA